ncbi:MAG: hypothetical protein ACM3S4_12005 [Burkholderiales bacterium]
MELDKLTDKEIAQRMVDYIERVDRLISRITPYLSSYKRCPEKDLILVEYKLQKDSIREDAHWLDLRRNYNRDNSLLQTYFRWTIPEVAACGLMAPTNSDINLKLLNSLAEARYRLQKHLSLEKWGKLTNK